MSGTMTRIREGWARRRLIKKIMYPTKSDTPIKPEIDHKYSRLLWNSELQSMS